MGFNFRKSFKIAPGVRLNVGKKGISSVSVGGKGARVSVGKKGTRTTVGIPGTGLSYSSHQSFKSNKQQKPREQPPTLFNSDMPPPLSSKYREGDREVSILLGLGIFFLPYIFSWFTLRQGYTTLSRVLSFGWMILLILMMK